MVLISEISAHENNTEAETQLLVPFTSGCWKACYIESGQHSSPMRFEGMDHEHCEKQPLIRMLIQAPKPDHLTHMWNAPISKLMESLENAKTIYIRRDTVKMSLILNEHNSQNFSNDLENFKSWEIQPYVPNIVQDQGLYAKKYPDHSRLVQVLREMIVQSTSKLRQTSVGQTRQRTTDGVLVAIPLSNNVADHDFPINAITPNVKKHTPTRPAGGIWVSFQLPKDCGIDVTLMVDKLHRLPTHQFSFSERLEKWRIEHRQRSNGRFDLYYYHKKACRMFRSTIEVVNFLLYEAYPNKLREANNRALKGDNSVHKYENKEKILKRKSISPICKSSCKSKKEKKCFSAKFHEGYTTESVKHFLAASYEKFLSVTSSLNHGSSEVEKSTVFSSVSKKQARKRKMIEEFLDVAHKNLLNYFNIEETIPKVYSLIDSSNQEEEES